MPSFEAPRVADAESRKKASFELVGVSVPAEEFAQHPAEAAEATYEAKEHQEELRVFYDHVEEAVSNIESVLPEAMGPQDAGEKMLPVSESEESKRASETTENGAVLLKMASLAERIPGGKNALGALALVIGLSSLPKQAEARSFDPLEVASKEMKREVDRGTRQASKDVGRAVGGMIEETFGTMRKSVGLETPQERAKREREEQKAENELKRKHQTELREFDRDQMKRVREDTRKVMEYERATERYRQKLDNVRRSFNQEFDRAQASYIEQRERASSPAQVKRYEREQWQRWLQAAREGMSRLEQYETETGESERGMTDIISDLTPRVMEGRQQREELKRTSEKMKSALSKLAAKMERNLGVTGGEQSPLRGLEEDSPTDPRPSRATPSKVKESLQAGDWDNIDPKYRF